MNSEKITSPLSNALQEAAEDDRVDVVVELAGYTPPPTSGLSRTEKTAALKEAFATHAAPVADEIRRIGGEITGQAWINGSLRARLAKKMVPVLSSQDHVGRLDVPHAIKAEG